ncbi:MAG: hypothetical protein JW780_06740 [Clostridiales bacterium]|nr:hypothetical protein [Clostridiales bacterium]
MKNKYSIMIFALIISTIFLSSCGLDLPDESQSSTTPPSTEAPTKVTETTPPTETIVSISTEKVIFEEYEPYLSFGTCAYLLRAEKAFVFDNNIRDGLQAQDKFSETELPAGAVMADLREFRPGTELYPGKTLFLLPDDRCVFFEQSTSNSGETIYNGKPEKEFMRNQEYYYDYYEGEPKVVENYELLPDTPLDPAVAPQNITISVDWNGDGKTDTIKRECADVRKTWDQTVWFTDGATGEKTDITDRFARDMSGEFGGLTDFVMLFRDEKTGRYALIDCFDTCSCDYSIFVYSYDKKSIVSYTEKFGVFVYDDGKMYEDYGSFIFGNLATMRTPLVFDGKNVQTDPTIREFWWLTALKAKENGEAIPGYFSYTLKDVPVEKKTADGYEDAVIPAGIAVFPKFYTWNEDKVRDAGYLYFVLVDGSEYRIAFEQEPYEWTCTFDGVPQEELFRCEWGG